MEFEYQQSIQTNYQGLDYTNTYRLSAILNYFSDLATDHALKLGMWDPNQVSQYGWIVSKIHLEFNEYISNRPFLLKTIVGKPSKVIFPRYFQIICDDVVIGNASSIWTLLDLEKRRIVVPTRVGFQAPSNDFYEPPCRLPEMIEEVNYEYKESRKVRYSDLDTNRHMNNTRYIDWACDLIGYEFFEENYISSLDIFFLKEIGPDQTVDLYYYQQDQTIYIKGVVEEIDCFKIKFGVSKKN